MLRRVTRPQLKNLLKENDSVFLYIGNIKNGIFWNGTYNKEVTSIEEAELAMQYAKTHGWNGKLYFGIKV